MNDIFWCIGGGLLQMPVLENARKLGLDVVISDGNPNCVCADKADIFAHIDIFDIDGHLQHASHLRKTRNIIGVLAAGIDAPMTMSALCEMLELPGVPLTVSDIVHHKSKFRDFSYQNDIDTPFFKLFHADEIDILDDYLKDFPLPFIIKNVDSSGSRGTKIFYMRDKEEELRIAREAIRVSKTNAFLVESVWKGQECTVETLFDINGNFHRCFITDRVFDYSSGVPMEIGLVSPSQLPDEEQNACFQLAQDVAAKLGINIGAAKFDMIVTNEGPRIIEMTTRLSGGFDCQYVVPAASGKNIIRAAILTACGKSFPSELLEDRVSRVVVTRSHWPKRGKIKAILGVEEALEIDNVEHIFFRRKVGDFIDGYDDCTDRVSFVIASGKTLDEAENAAKNALATVAIEVEDD